jgi:ribosomal protein S18 acetylase RimI-like enzyme
MASAPAVIRRATPSDAAALSKIAADTFVESFGHLYTAKNLEDFLAEAYDVDDMRAYLEDSTKASWLVERDGAAVGFAQAERSCSLPHGDISPACVSLRRIYLLKSAQSSGIGGKLFGEAMAWLQEGASTPRNVWLGVWSENHGAQRFYVRNGFSKVGDYKFKVGDHYDEEFIFMKPAAAFAAESPAAAPLASAAS